MTLTNIITKKFILSEVYDEIILKYLEEGEDRMNSANNTTKNFFFRTGGAKELGAWKWLPSYQFRALIAEFVFSDRKGIDFGGLFGPIYGNTVIVDIHRAHGGIKFLKDIKDEDLDYIFSSHTLEHVFNLRDELSEMYRVLKKKGNILFIVPAYTCVRWRHGILESHLRTFSLEGDKWTRIDKEVEKVGFKLYAVRYCWDNSIFLFGEKL